MKYYRCIRDLFHYKYNGNVYNFRMGQIVPYTPIVQNNLLNFEIFGKDFHVEGSQKEVLVIETTEPIVVSNVVEETLIEPTVEVEITAIEEVIPVVKKRTRKKKTEVVVNA